MRVELLYLEMSRRSIHGNSYSTWLTFEKGGGCVNGGGQPFTNGDYEKVKARGAGLYVIDKNKPQRKSHENEDIKKLYDEFLGEIGGHNEHKYLHTHYFDKSNPYSKKNDVSLQTN